MTFPKILEDLYKLNLPEKEMETTKILVSILTPKNKPGENSLMMLQKELRRKKLIIP